MMRSIRAKRRRAGAIPVEIAAMSTMSEAIKLLTGLPVRLRRLLHRALDFLADSRYAERQAGRRALYTTG